MDLTIYSDVPNETPGSYCRFCFRETELVPIFHPATLEPVNRQLLDIILECTDIQLTADNDFPSSACQNCLQVLQEFYHFRRRTKEYDRIIRTKAVVRIEPEVLIVKQEPLEDDTLESVRRQYLADKQLQQQQQRQDEEETEEADEDEHDIGSSSSTLTAEEMREEEFQHPSLNAIFKIRTISTGSSGSKSTTTTTGPSSNLEENRCMVCGEKFSTREAWISHLPLHAGERPFQCHICLAQFKTKYVQQNHIKTVHENIRSYQCQVCTDPIRQFKSKRTLEDHMRYHTGERPFLCTQCNVSFSSGSVHRNHMYRVHREMRKKDRKCSYCGKEFDRILDLKRHQTSYCEKIVGRAMAERL
ncbi:zinc finger and BTB domain-containing protein 17-like [Ochlerotatus camptorhynchus]|uniref:zinc finger and BTB domain-containing protein 17-like n=1 Tax=Ochlerotatus camptorhynchus TaxID=644619 RepID=UPI0031D66012